MHRLGTSAILLFLRANLKNQREDSTDIIQFCFLLCFRLRTLQGRNGEFRGVFSFLVRHLGMMTQPIHKLYSYQQYQIRDEKVYNGVVAISSIKWFPTDLLLFVASVTFCISVRGERK